MMDAAATGRHPDPLAMLDTRYPRASSRYPATTNSTSTTTSSRSAAEPQCAHQCRSSQPTYAGRPTCCSSRSRELRTVTRAVRRPWEASCSMLVFLLLVSALLQAAIINATPIFVGSTASELQATQTLPPVNSTTSSPATSTSSPDPPTQTFGEVDQAQLDRVEVVVDDAPPSDFLDIFQDLASPRTPASTSTLPPTTASPQGNGVRTGRAKFFNRTFVTTGGPSTSSPTAGPSTVFRQPHKAVETCMVRTRKAKVRVCGGREQREVDVKRCGGMCRSQTGLRALPVSDRVHYLSAYVRNHHHSHCRCCQATEVAHVQFDFQCKSGERSSFKMAQALTCACQTCR